MIATGNDEFSQVLAERIGQFIIDADANSARTMQKAIGPSEVGEPCERQLAYKILDWPESNDARDPIAAIIGTGFHLWIGERFEARNEALGGSRYKVETRVTVRDSPIATAKLEGSADLYDRLIRANLDWKLVGTSSHDKYRRQGPGEKYRIQAHLYGLGQENAGEHVDRVVIVFIARYHELKVHVWSEPYDRTVAENALARLDRIRNQVQALEPEANPDAWQQFAIPEKPNCRFCAYLKPGSSDLAQGCPGGQSGNAGAQLQALIA